jgi:TDG/mug DNA glycosylase family protein
MDKQVAMPPRPTRAQLLAATAKKVPDIVARDLAVLFCGINPGLYSAATGHHFARPGNKFWKALAGSGFSPRLLAPWEEQELLEHGCGITNLVARASARADELSVHEFVAGHARLVRKIRRYEPRFVAVLGVGAYRLAFQKPAASLGRQEERIGNTTMWVLPSPSGLNAHHQLSDLVRLFRELREAAFA